ncbi:MAG: hypothetical protein GC204_16735 [Chloroflexi bacterium]|nr:hypothetical protein [Chloroflexota bacterium]
MLPARVIHADWSANPRKRWMAEAILGEDNRYTVRAPKLIRDAGLFMLTAMTAAAGGVLIGFDFPIGLPLSYARKVGIDNFLTVLPQFGEGQWAKFYQVAGQADEINLYRPFYPAKSGGKLRAHLTSALGLTDLRRECDRKTADRPAAAELFWTMGAQQVGKAAISGWQELLAPALKMNEYVRLAIWPFAGAFEALLQPGWIVACEAYPTEFYRHVGVRFPRKAGKGQKSGKRVQADRRANAPTLLEFAQARDIQFDAALVDAVSDGFGADAFGEDRFDALVSLLGMLNIALGYHPPGDPLTPEIAQVEGWILGMANEQF